jgi:beta-galactosidase
MKTTCTCFILLLVTTLMVKSQKSNKYFPEKDLITVGIYYYPEHWNPSQWERDIRQISSMGFEFIHLAEFAWAQMEPEEGKYDFTWLDQVIDLAGKYNLKVILCTPSATPPVWLGIRYPDTYIMNSNYLRAEHGTRANGSLTNMNFRQHVENINTEMAQRYGKNEHVTGWQIDNEPEAKSDFSPSAQEAFRQWLVKKYNTIGKLNTAWGNAFWSQLYNSFDQIIIPNANLVGWWGSNPHALLDYKRFTADVQAEFLDFQAAVLRKYISPLQYITTNYTASSAGSDPHRTKMLDFATFTSYPNGGQHNLGNQGFRLGNSRPLTFANDYYRNITGVTGIMELQPGPVNWGSVNPLLMPGAVRMWLWHSFGAGSSLACSYRFRQILYGAEQYHAGIMNTDGITPSPGGKEYMQFIAEIKELRKFLKPESKMPEEIAARYTAILWNHENFWSIDRQRQTGQWDAWGFPGKYQEILKSFGAPVDFVNESADLSGYKVVVVPAYELVDSVLIMKWTDYAANGGNLIITCRTATKDRMGHFWEAEIAAPISGLIGAHVIATDMLPGDVQGEITSKSSHYAWNNWADLLQVEKETEVLATYSNQFYTGKAAVVKHVIGKGTVTYIGVNTDDSKLEKDILREVYNKAGITTEDYPNGVYVYWRYGFYVAVNYSSDDYTVNIPNGAKVIFGDSVMKPAGVMVWTE